MRIYNKDSGVYNKGSGGYNTKKCKANSGPPKLLLWSRHFAWTKIVHYLSCSDGCTHFALTNTMLSFGAPYIYFSYTGT